MVTEEIIHDVVKGLKELSEDNSVPRNVKTKILDTIKLLEEQGDVSIRVNKALSHLDEIAEDANMETYTRTQIWNLLSQLESIKN
jgi:uncharacterized protein (UPF0147 family)